MTFHLAVTLIALGVAAYIVYRVITRYRAATGTVWQRLLATAKGSATILWQYAVILGSFIYSGLGTITDFLNMPELKAVLQDHLSPQSLAVVLLLIAGVSIVARLRSR